MPFKSMKQARYFQANRKKLEAQGVDVGEWVRSTDFSRLKKTAAILTRVFRRA